MYLALPHDIRVSVDRARDRLNTAFVANIEVDFPLLCPACQRLNHHRVQALGTLYFVGENELGPPTFRLPVFSDLWLTLAECVGSVYCEHCGTCGRLPRGQAEVAVAYLRESYPDKVMVETLEQAGFAVSLDNRTYRCASFLPSDRFEVAPCR